MVHSHIFSTTQRRNRALEESIRWPQSKASSSLLSDLVSSQSTLSLRSHELFLLVPLCSKSGRTSAAMNLSLSGVELRVPPKEGHLWAEAHVSLTCSKEASSVCHPGSFASSRSDLSSSQIGEKQERADPTEHIPAHLNGLQNISI